MMNQRDIRPAIDLLQRRHTTCEAAATIEDMAVACGIVLDAPFSYREVVEMAEALALSPYVVRFWENGVRRYYAGSYTPYHPHGTPRNP